jgi:hypothetical protein
MSSFAISPGIVLEDGTVLGRISDIDLFESFEVQTDKTMLSPEIDGVASKLPLFSESKQKEMRANNTGGRLWSVKRKGKAQVARENEARRQREVKLRTEVMAEAFTLGVATFEFENKTPLMIADMGDDE